MTKTILITGASTGIGRATALLFAKKGWNVAATMRNLDKGKDLLTHSNIRLFKLDVMDPKSISEAFDACRKTFGAIDVIHNNAGYGLVGAFEAFTRQQIQKQFETNVFGVMNVTREILPYFRERKAGLIITSSSMGGLVTFPLWSVYHSTKWAVEGFLESLHYELRPFNIRVKNIEPGSTRTDFETSIEFVTSAPYEDYSSKVNQTMLDSYKNAPSGDLVAEKVWIAATDNSTTLRYPVGGQSRFILLARKFLPNNWFFRIVRNSVEKGVR